MLYSAGWLSQDLVIPNSSVPLWTTQGRVQPAGLTLICRAEASPSAGFLTGNNQGQNPSLGSQNRVLPDFLISILKRNSFDPQ